MPNVSLGPVIPLPGRPMRVSRGDVLNQLVTNEQFRQEFLADPVIAFRKHNLQLYGEFNSTFEQINPLELEKVRTKMQEVVRLLHEIDEVAAGNWCA